MTTPHPFFSLWTPAISWHSQPIYRVVPVKCTCVVSDTNSNHFWRSWNTFGHGKQKQWREHLWRSFRASISAKGEPSLSVSTYRALGHVLSLVAKFVQSNMLISPELLRVLEEETTRDLYSLDFLSKLMLLFLRFIPHLKMENVGSVCGMRSKIWKQMTGGERVWHWNVLNLSFCCSEMEDCFRFWSAKSQTNPLFTKQEASLSLYWTRRKQLWLKKKTCWALLTRNTLID